MGIDLLYNRNTQVRKFENIFGKLQRHVSRKIKKDKNEIILETDKYETDNYFSRCHFTPHADFATPEEQAATYYFHNCYPGKQTMNAQNWSVLVEEYAREMNRFFKTIIRVYTGVYGQLEYPNLNGKMTKFFMDFANQRVEIPKLSWKLIINEETEEAVAFFTSNETNMNATQICEFKKLCTSVCDEIGVNIESEVTGESLKDEEVQKTAKMNRAGFTTCCSYSDFTHIIDFLPVKLKKDAPLLKSDVKVKVLKEYRIKLAKQRKKRAALQSKKQIQT